MNQLVDVADAAFGLLMEPAETDADTEFVLPLDATRTVTLIRNQLSGIAVLSVSTRPIPADESEVATRREALLRRTSESRQTTGFIGSLGPDGEEIVSMILGDLPRDARHVEGLIESLIRSFDPAAPTASSANVQPGTAEESWLKI